MRVISGEAKGRRLKAPKGRDTRPTTDRVRESLFGILGDRCGDARVLDLFSGTGALGIESLSRGAGSAVLIEKDPNAFAIITENLSSTGLPGGEAYKSDAFKALDTLRRKGYAFDLVFLDPPYGHGLELRALALILEYGLLAPGGLVVVEHMSKETFEPVLPGLKVVRHEKYGETTLTFLLGDKQ